MSVTTVDDMKASASASDRTPKAIQFAISLCVIAGFSAMMGWGVYKDSQHDLVVAGFNTLNNLVVAVVTYWIGGSFSSERKQTAQNDTAATLAANATKTQ